MTAAVAPFLAGNTYTTSPIALIGWEVISLQCPKEDPMSHRFRSVVAALSAAALLSGAVAAPAQAQSDVPSTLR